MRLYELPANPLFQSFRFAARNGTQTNLQIIYQLLAFSSEESVAIHPFGTLALCGLLVVAFNITGRRDRRATCPATVAVIANAMVGMGVDGLEGNGRWLAVAWAAGASAKGLAIEGANMLRTESEDLGSFEPRKLQWKFAEFDVKTLRMPEITTGNSPRGFMNSRSLVTSQAPTLPLPPWDAGWNNLPPDMEGFPCIWRPGVTTNV